MVNKPAVDNMDLKRIFSEKKIFLTGHTGFKGSWLLYWMYSLGAQLKGYSLAPELPENLFNAIRGEELCESVIGDIRNLERMEAEVMAFQPDFIFHLAAQPLVRLSYEMPLDTFETNVMGTANILQVITKLQKPCTVVIITTDKVYENKEWIYPYRENEMLGGLDPYSASKACAELVTQSYLHSFFSVNKIAQHGKGIATARAGNVIGGGDWAKDRIIPDIVKAFSKHEPVHLRNPLSVRPWQHVLEPLSGYMLLAAQLSENPSAYAGAWNFGPHIEDCLTVEDLVKKAIEIWGEGEYVDLSHEDSPHEARLLKLDINKAINGLKWKPKWDSAIAIDKTLAWYKAYTKENARELLKADIESYTS